MSWIEWLGRNWWWLLPAENFAVVVLAVSPAYFYLSCMDSLYHEALKTHRDRLEKLEHDRDQ